MRLLFATLAATALLAACNAPAPPNAPNPPPAPAAPATPELPATPDAKATLDPVIADVKAQLAKDFTTEPDSWQSAQVDVTGDGQKEFLLMPQSMDWCGSGGCTLLVVEQRNGTWTVISQSTVTRAPIRVSENKTNGWFDLIVHSNGADHVLKSDGKKYPLNPSMQPKATDAEINNSSVVIGE